MTSRIFVLMALAMLALPLCASLALGDESKDTAAKAAPDADDMADAKDMKEAVPPATTKKYSGNICEITGVVTKMKKP